MFLCPKTMRNQFMRFGRSTCFFFLRSASQACHGFSSDAEQVFTCLFPAPLVGLYTLCFHQSPVGTNATHPCCAASTVCSSATNVITPHVCSLLIYTPCTTRRKSVRFPKKMRLGFTLTRNLNVMRPTARRVPCLF